ncbi:MAG: AAA family ATPase [Patescibacteria group bacterium]
MEKGQIILICGGSGSGKSTLAKKFGDAAIISTDNFYIGKSKMIPMENGEYDFDDPCAVDLDECAKMALNLAGGKEVFVPEYDMVTSERVGQIKIIPAKSGLVVVEGVFALHDTLRQIGNLKIFIDTPTDERLARRIKRDNERGRSEAEVIKHSTQVEASHKKHIEPMKQHADLILGREGW